MTAKQLENKLYILMSLCQEVQDRENSATDLERDFANACDDLIPLLLLMMEDIEELENVDT